MFRLTNTPSAALVLCPFSLFYFIFYFFSSSLNKVGETLFVILTCKYSRFIEWVFQAVQIVIVW